MHCTVSTLKRSLGLCMAYDTTIGTCYCQLFVFVTKLHFLLLLIGTTTDGGLGLDVEYRF